MNQSAPSVEETVDRRFRGWGGIVCGTPDEIATELTKEVDLGVERFVIQLWDFATPNSIETFARDVIPRVRSASG